MEKIAVLGPNGTFSDSASIEYINEFNNELEQVYYSTIDDAFHSVGDECEVGIIPVENTLDGYVQRTLDLLLEMNVYIENEISIPVQFSLVSNTENIEDIKKLYVQFKTSGQCRKFIDGLRDVQIIITESNMESFNKAEEGNIGEAAIIPGHMFEHSTASFKIKNVTDSINNYTRFIVVRQGDLKVDITDNKDIKVPLYIMPDNDRPGILFDILKEFSLNRINLVSIMSRPTKLDMGTYNFYLEINGDFKQKEKIINTINKIKEDYKIKVLGFYSIN